MGKGLSPQACVEGCAGLAQVPNGFLLAAAPADRSLSLPGRTVPGPFHNRKPSVQLPSRAGLVPGLGTLGQVCQPAWLPGPAVLPRLNSWIWVIWAPTRFGLALLSVSCPEHHPCLPASLWYPSILPRVNFVLKEPKRETKRFFTVVRRQEGNLLSACYLAAVDSSMLYALLCARQSSRLPPLA